MSRRDREVARGQTLVEFALILPVLLMLLMGVFDLGRVVLANDMVSNAAREAARFAIVHGGSAITACPVGPTEPGADIPAPSADCPYPSPSTEAIREVAREWAIAAGSEVDVQVCYGSGCSGSTHTGTNAKGTPVTVTVSSTVSMVVPALIGFTSFGVSATSTMVVNN